jgi:hypothetical protein
MSNIFDAGRKYEIRFTFKKLRGLRKNGVDITDETKSGNLVMLLQNTEKLAESLWFLIQDQVDTETEDQFYEALDREALDEGWQAIRSAFVDFAPHGSRAKLNSVIDGQLAAVQEASDKVVELISSPEVQAELDRQIDKMQESVLSEIRNWSLAI